MFNYEPVAIVNTVRLVALAGMTFGLKLSTVQLMACMTALEAVLTLFTRSQVHSNATMAQTVKEMTHAASLPTGTGA